MPPSSATAPSTSACTAASSVTSHGIDGTPSSAADSASRRSWASEIRTVAPSSMHRLAVAKPMPVPAAAVTTTRLPASSPCPGT